jgi:hypothetical protein
MRHRIPRKRTRWPASDGVKLLIVKNDRIRPSKSKSVRKCDKSATWDFFRRRKQRSAFAGTWNAPGVVLVGFPFVLITAQLF